MVKNFWRGSKIGKLGDVLLAGFFSDDGSEDFHEFSGLGNELVESCMRLMINRIAIIQEWQPHA